MRAGDLDQGIKSIEDLIENILILWQEYDLETRAESRMRQIDRISAHQNHIFKRYKYDVAQLRARQSYKDAILLCNAVRQVVNSKDDHLILQELEELKSLQQALSDANELIAKLSRIPELLPFFRELSNAIRQVDDSQENSLLRNQINYFLFEKKTDVNGFLAWWDGKQQSNFTQRPSIDLSRLAERVGNGEIALFLGSGITHDDSQDKEFVDDLAQKAGYKDFSGSLSSIAEYYKLRPDFGTLTLLTSLHQSLSSNSNDTKLYKALASLSKPLIIVSASYDNLLEKEFLANKKPFVEISSIIKKYDQYDVGHTIVYYSDKDSKPSVCLEEEVSYLNLLENGYSIIYKIRGACKSIMSQDDFLRHASLTLTENDYFDFARHIEKVIPSYLIRHMIVKSLLFIGFRPRNWEERLLANALIKKRKSGDQPYYLIEENPEPLEEAYWEQHSIKKYITNLTEFEEALLRLSK